MDPSDTERQVGLNPLLARRRPIRPSSLWRIWSGLFRSLYKASPWGARTDDTMRAAIGALARARELHPCEVPLILTDPNFRRRIVSQTRTTRSGWRAISDGSRTSRTWRASDGHRPGAQQDSGLLDEAEESERSWDRPSRQSQSVEVMASGKIPPLLPSASGILGDEAAAILGALIVAEIWNANNRSCRNSPRASA